MTALSHVATATTPDPLVFPFFRGCDESRVLWTSDETAARELLIQDEPNSLIVFGGMQGIQAFADELAREILDGADVFAEDAEFLAGLGIELPKGLCYDPADFPVSNPTVHPAVTAARAARSLGKTTHENLWTAVLSGPSVVTILPPLALSEGQIAETAERLHVEFTGARVGTTTVDGVTAFVLSALPVEAA